MRVSDADGAVEDGRVRRGRRTRRAILDVAVDLASVEGLEGLSIGRLAGALSVSKSGVFAHFGSKEDLQVAVLDAARDAFADEVAGALGGSRPGLARLRRLCDVRLEYMRTAHPGGCFFYAVGAEFDARPGAVRDRAAAARREWLDLLRRLVVEAYDLGHLRAEVDTDVLAFELDAFAQAANGDALLLGDPAAFDRARAATLAALRRAAADPAVLDEAAAR